MVADVDWDLRNTYASSHPSRILLGPGGELVKIDSSVSDADIQAILPTAYP